MVANLRNHKVLTTIGALFAGFCIILLIGGLTGPKVVTQKVTKDVPGPTVTVTATATKSVPGPTVTKNVPGPTTTQNVPGPTVTKNVPGPTVTKNVPGPTVTKNVTPQACLDFITSAQAALTFAAQGFNAISTQDWAAVANASAGIKNLTPAYQKAAIACQNG